MIEIVNFISPYVYIFLVVGSVIFGITLAVNLWVYHTVQKIRKETDKNFTYNLSSSEMQEVFFAINTAKKDYYKIVEQNEKSKKKSSKKVPKTLVLDAEKEPKFSDVFVALMKGVYKPFSVVNGVERGYLSFTKNEIFEVSRTVLKRLDELLTRSGVGFIKNIKVSHLATGISFYVGYKNFLEKIWVVFIFKLIDFSMWFLRIFSPVSITKYLIKNFTAQNLSLLICDTLVETVGKELAVIYKQERIKLEKEDLSKKKAV